MASYVCNIELANGSTVPVGSALYGTCTTAANTAAKVVTLNNFDKLITGVTVHIKFTNSNTAANPTLNINNTGAKTIYRYGTTAPGTTVETSWNAGAVLTFTYDGTYWQMNDQLNTTYSVATDQVDGLMSASDKAKIDSISSDAEANQNAFSNIKIGDTTIEADTETDTIELIDGDNITLTPGIDTDTRSKSITIAAIDTTYENKEELENNEEVSLVTRGEKYTWNHKQSALTRPVTGAAEWDKADVITTTNASSGNVIKASGKTIATSITNVDTTVPTSKAVKTYVDGLVANATHFKGGFAATGDGAIDGGATTLKSVAEAIGDMYTCTTAGTIYGITFEIGDSIIFTKAVAAGTAPTSGDFITVEGETSVSVVDNNPTLAWGTKSKIATIEGTEINVTMPANPDTHLGLTASEGVLRLS